MLFVIRSYRKFVFTTPTTKYLKSSKLCYCQPFQLSAGRKAEVALVNPSVNDKQLRTVHDLEGSLQVFLHRTLLKDFCSSHQLSKMADNKFLVDYAKMGTSKCKKCKQGIEKKAPRIAKLVPNPFSDDGGDMKQYFHINCIFESFLRARSTTKKIEDTSDLDGFENMEDVEKNLIRKHIDEMMSKLASKKSPAKKKTVQGVLTTAGKVVSPTKATTTPASSNSSQNNVPSTSSRSFSTNSSTTDTNHPDNSFREYRKLCARIADVSSYLAKTREVAEFLKKGSGGDSYQGDSYLLLKLLLPGVVKRVYNLNNKQIVKLFSQIFQCDLDDMVTDLEQGDVSETVRKFFVDNTASPPAKKSTLTLPEVVLEALDPNAYEAFQASRNLRDVVDRVNAKNDANGVPGMSKKLSVRANLMTPVLPMLAEACKSVAQAISKCPNGMYSEIKYDGERVQIHKQGNDFQYFSRSLKQVLPHKVAHIKEYLPKACPHGNDVILDSEILMVDKNGKILPFGTLGIHKKTAFQDANACLFVFDCIHFNGENLMNKPLKERRKILEQNMTPISNRIMFSEMQFIKEADDLSTMIRDVIREGLEGLVLKDINSVYEPGKRHWLKVKKDYLSQGAMADSADLIVLGAHYGTGNKGGMMSVFLMGVHDPVSDKFYTVTKCGNGLDDETLAKVNEQLEVVKISKNMGKKAPVWEIIGAEFSKSDIHTAEGISIRFPRVTRMRNDKDYTTATNLPRLRTLFEKSKEETDVGHLLPGSSNSNNNKRKANSNSKESESPAKKTKAEREQVDSPSKKVKVESNRSEQGSSNSGSPRKEDDRPVCRYGASCYQKNPEHRRKFSHSAENGGSHKGLPNVFSGMTLYIPAGTKHEAKLKRYVIAYDGDVVDEIGKSNATHVVCDDDTKDSSGQKAVTSRWLWKCIEHKKLVPETKQD
ncbi:DNA ligase 3 [Holothuria leucospilota]|uniref:DNA ligase n=1 Tax=Holothuria leucospilota TaxID=206669 RepID=A0A9Q0YH95_HOLLE|nr:DNA ligase 3 [Holothuria leucospilota]